MKILLVANTDWYLFNFRRPLARALRESGHRVVFVCPPGPYVGRMRADGWRCETLPISRQGVHPVHEFVTVMRLLCLYRRERPDIVHHFTIKCVIYGGIAARIAGPFAVVNSVTGLGHVFVTQSARNRLLRPMISLLYGRVLPRSEVIFENPDDQVAMGERGIG